MSDDDIFDGGGFKAMAMDGDAFRRLPKELQNIIKEAAKRAQKGIVEFGEDADLGITVEDILEMDVNEADEWLEKWLNKAFEGFQPALDVKVTVRERGFAHRISMKHREYRAGVAHHMPQYLRDAIEGDFNNRFLEAGAKVLKIDWKFVRYCPRVYWEYQGHDYYADFYYDGTLMPNDHVKVEDTWKYTIETLVPVANKVLDIEHEGQDA